MCLMLYSIVLASLFCAVVCKIKSEDFIFPLEKSSAYNVCTFRNSTAGHCTIASQCPEAHEEYINGVKPTLCYFAKSEPVVCCVLEKGREIITTSTLDHLALFNTEEYNEDKTITLSPLFDPRRHEWVTNAPTTTESSTTQNLEKPITEPIIPSEQLVPRRKSLVNCEDHYSQPVPFKRTPGFFHVTVVGGQATSEGEFPHMAALGWTNEQNKVSWKCGGALISQDYVLTAAHCVGRTPPDIIRLGAKDLMNVDAAQDFGIEKIIPHPNYSGKQLYHDIALIKLNKSVEITIKIRPACLWQGSESNFTNATATGYGNTEYGGKPSTELLKVDLKVFNNDECSEGYKSERSLPNGIIESQLCAGDSEGGKDTCQGDSGGPIQVSTKNEQQFVYHIIGVTSFGKACATMLPGVYTRVSYYLDWIEDIVWD